MLDSTEWFRLTGDRKLELKVTPMSKSSVLNSLRTSDAAFLEAQLSLCIADLQSLLLSKSSSGHTSECATRLLDDLQKNHKAMSQTMRTFIESSTTCSLADKFIYLDSLESHATAALLQYLLLIQDARKVLRAERPKPASPPDTNPHSDLPPSTFDFYDDMAKKAGVSRETAKQACFAAAYGNKPFRKSDILDALQELGAALNSPSTPVKVRVVFVPHEQ